MNSGRRIVTNGDIVA